MWLLAVIPTIDAEGCPSTPCHNDSFLIYSAHLPLLQIEMFANLPDLIRKVALKDVISAESMYDPYAMQHSHRLFARAQQ